MKSSELSKWFIDSPGSIDYFNGRKDQIHRNRSRIQSQFSNAIIHSSANIQFQIHRGSHNPIWLLLWLPDKLHSATTTNNEIPFLPTSCRWWITQSCWLFCNSTRLGQSFLRFGFLQFHRPPLIRLPCVVTVSWFRIPLLSYGIWPKLPTNAINCPTIRPIDDGWEFIKSRLSPRKLRPSRFDSDSLRIDHLLINKRFICDIVHILNLGQSIGHRIDGVSFRMDRYR